MSTKKKDLLRRLAVDLGREMGARTILFHAAVAERLGVSVTDLKCLDYISRTPETTAGDLAEITGLTTGAITGVVDRLEKAGLAQRERSAEDRRKVLIRLLPAARSRTNDIFGQLAGDMEHLAAGYSTEQLELIAGFMEAATDILRRNAQRVRALEA